jgi:hypothetical protein
VTPVNPAANSMAHIIDFHSATGALAALVSSKAFLEANGSRRRSWSFLGTIIIRAVHHTGAPSRMRAGIAGTSGLASLTAPAAAQRRFIPRKIASADVDTTLKHRYNYYSASL